jgi:rubredoxin
LQCATQLKLNSNPAAKYKKEKLSNTVKINFKGGIISPGNLYNILVATTKAGILYVGFGLRQQLLIDVSDERLAVLKNELDALNVLHEISEDRFPNVISSYPAEEVFITNTWLSEGVYKDIFDLMDYEPRLKINVSDSNQSFTPMLTGNINWVASAKAQHFWHLFIRFPKTNTVFEWNQMVYTNDVARVSKEIEELIFSNKQKFYDNANAVGDDLFNELKLDDYILKQADEPAVLPQFNLPYYEGLNRYNNKYWLGIYRRDELYSVAFLKELCSICLETKIGLLCSTPWKTIIVKGIEEKDRHLWNKLLEKYQINMRHAANELNFQVEDNCKDGLELKSYLVRSLNNDDTRTFGICIGIKTRSKSEVFSSILIRRRPLIKLWKFQALFVYDILCAKDFNPNERTGNVFSRNNPKLFLTEPLRRAVLSYYDYKSRQSTVTAIKEIKKEDATLKHADAHVYQCKHCLSIYDEQLGEPENGIASKTLFSSLPEDFVCQTCDAGKDDFKKTSIASLYLQAI